MRFCGDFRRQNAANSSTGGSKQYKANGVMDEPAGERGQRRANSRKVSRSLLVLDLLFIEEAGKGDNVGVDLFGLLAVLRHGE